MKATVLMIAGVLFAAPAPAGAADLPIITKVRPAPATADNIHSYGDRNASCQAWTDGCRRCERAGDTPSCSNIGIACQPGPVKCEAEANPAQ
jgi:hypothetical protein